MISEAEGPIQRSRRQAAPASRRLLSPLTLRVLASNGLALMILAGGLVFLLGQYREELFEAKVADLSTNGAIIAGILSEGAVEETHETITRRVETGARYVSKFSQLTGTRVRLIDEDGSLVVDSHTLLGGVSEVRTQIIFPAVEEGSISKPYS